MNPFLNNDNNTLLIHLHLAKTVPVHFQIMPKNSNCLQQKIPVPYRRNRDTVYIQNLIKFNQLCLIFSLYRSLHKYMSRIPCNFFKTFDFSHILAQMSFCFLVSVPIRHIYHIFLFSSHSFHTNLNLVHVLVSSSHSSSIVLSLFILILTLFMFPFLFPVLIPVQ